MCKVFQVMTLISEKQKPESKYTLGYLICILFSANWLKCSATKSKNTFNGIKWKSSAVLHITDLYHQNIILVRHEK